MLGCQYQMMRRKSWFRKHTFNLILPFDTFLMKTHMSYLEKYILNKLSFFFPVSSSVHTPNINFIIFLFWVHIVVVAVGGRPTVWLAFLYQSQGFSWTASPPHSPYTWETYKKSASYSFHYIVLSPTWLKDKLDRFEAKKRKKHIYTNALTYPSCSPLFVLSLQTLLFY